MVGKIPENGPKRRSQFGNRLGKEQEQENAAKCGKPLRSRGRNREPPERETPMRLFLISMLLLAVLACGGDTTAPARIEVAGSWNGSFASGGVGGTLVMTLQETSGSVTGNGNLSGGGFATALTVTGTYAEPNTALALHTPGFSDISLSGVVSDRSLTGILNGSGFVGVSITMARQ